MFEHVCTCVVWTGRLACSEIKLAFSSERKYDHQARSVSAGIERVLGVMLDAW